jgi:hypothetical protein
MRSKKRTAIRVKRRKFEKTGLHIDLIRYVAENQSGLMEDLLDRMTGLHPELSRDTVQESVYGKYSLLGLIRTGQTREGKITWRSTKATEREYEFCGEPTFIEAATSHFHYYWLKYVIGVDPSELVRRLG